MALPTITRDSFPTLGLGADLCAVLKALVAAYNMFLDWVDEVNASLTSVDEKTVPVGSVHAIAANVVPTGYLPCNGQAVSRTTYANLFARIGTTHGVGDGSTTFNVPNLTDKGLFGSGSNSVGASIGENTHVLTTAETPAHTHTIDLEVDGAGGSGFDYATWETSNNATPAVPAGASTSSFGGGSAHNNIQASIVILWVIKY